MSPSIWELSSLIFSLAGIWRVVGRLPIDEPGRESATDERLVVVEADGDGGTVDDGLPLVLLALVVEGLAVVVVAEGLVDVVDGLAEPLVAVLEDTLPVELGPLFDGLVVAVTGLLFPTNVCDVCDDDTGTLLKVLLLYF